jgi:hypothetical protein
VHSRQRVANIFIPGGYKRDCGGYQYQISPLKSSKMKNTTKAFIASLLLSASIYSCQKDVAPTLNTSGNGSAGNGPQQLRIFLTDHQTPVFDSVFIDMQQMEVKVEDDSLGNEGWVNVTINPGVYNILRFRNGLDTLFANGTLPNARINKLRLTLGNHNSVMKNGQSFPLQLHNEDRQVVINIDESNFDVVAPGQLLFWIDFDAGRSIQVDNSGSGNNNGYRLKAHISAFTKHKSASIEGKVLPESADAIVMAISGTDTTMAIPDDDGGEFKIMGLHAGTYNVFYDGQNGYSDTTITNIQVSNSDERHLPTITLHQ